MKPVLRVIIGLTVGSLLWSCQPSKNLTTDSSAKSSVTDKVDYSLVYVIHGDASYLYHDEEGKGRQADVQAVKEAMEVAQEAEKGEVFIFHQRPESKILWLFPKKDRLFYHYKNGELINRQKYSPQSSQAPFKTEANFLKKHKSKDSNRQFLLYFGHEIPTRNVGYHHSRPEVAFNVDNFSKGVGSFLDEDKVFDLTVLSTCDNGSPDMASKIAPYSNAMLASPKNLHLSHIDTDSLLKLEENPDFSELDLAQLLATDTYQRLDQFIQTAVTLSVYNLRQQEQEIKSLQELYSTYKDNNITQIEAENVDCATLPFWDQSNFPPVNQVFYKPPRFGQKDDKKAFSGWGCKR